MAFLKKCLKLALKSRFTHGLYFIPSSSAQIPMFIYTSQSLFSHSYVVNEWLNRHCNVQMDIGIRADELGTISGILFGWWVLLAAFLA
jgi:hypothetical protein